MFITSVIFLNVNSSFVICIMSPCQSLMRSEFMTSGPRCIPGWAHVAFNATLVSWPWPCFNGRSLATKETLLVKIRAQKKEVEDVWQMKLARKDSLPENASGGLKHGRVLRVEMRLPRHCDVPLRRDHERHLEARKPGRSWNQLLQGFMSFHTFFSKSGEVCLCEHRLLRHI